MQLWRRCEGLLFLFYSVYFLGGAFSREKSPGKSSISLEEKKKYFLVCCWCHDIKTKEGEKEKDVRDECLIKKNSWLLLVCQQVVNPRVRFTFRRPNPAAHGQWCIREKCPGIERKRVEGRRRTDGCRSRRTARILIPFHVQVGVKLVHSWRRCLSLWEMRRAPIRKGEATRIFSDYQTS